MWTFFLKALQVFCILQDIQLKLQFNHQAGHTLDQFSLSWGSYCAAISQIWFCLLNCPELLWFFFCKSDTAMRWGSWPTSPHSCMLISVDSKDGWECANEGRAPGSTSMIFRQTLEPQHSFIKFPQMHMVECAEHLPTSFLQLQFSSFSS